MQQKPKISSHFLWEYYLKTFNRKRSYKIVIERVVQSGEIGEWREIYNFYKPAKILETIEWSKQLDKRDKDFTRLFINSDMLHAA